MKLWHKVALLLAIPIACQIGFVCYLYNVVAETGMEAQRANRARQMVVHLSALLKIIVDANQDIADNGWNDFVRKQSQTRQRFASELSILDKVAAVNTSERESLNRIKTQVASGLQCLALAEPLVVRGEFEESRQYLQQLKSVNMGLSGEIERTIEQMREIEETSPATQALSMARLQQLLIIGCSANLLITLFLLVIFNRSTAARFAQLMDNTKRYASCMPLHAPLAGNDEIAELDRVFNKMTAALTLAAQREREQQLELEKMKQDFVLMVSHDLMTPLSSVKNFLEMQSSGSYKIDEPGKRLLPPLLQSLARLEALVNGLLDLDRFEAGQLSLVLTDIKLSRLFEQSFEAVRLLAEQQVVSVVLPQTTAEFVGDADRLVQLLVNLTANAIKFSPPESKVVLSVLETFDFIEIRVSDQGRGIPAEMQAAIFEKFRQVTATDASKMGGRGLGLPICKAIVEAHGGSIGVESELGKGSTFWFKLPRVPVGARVTTS